MNREWENEPDRKHWIDAETGLDCLIVRNGLGGKGALCGYVGVPKSHPWHGKDYNQCKRADGEYIDVHGGLTFARGCNESGKICHSEEKDGKIANHDVWWLGFDCAHLGDFVPGMDDISPRRLEEFQSGYSSYKNIAYVENECRSLAKQAVAVQSP